MGELKSSPIFFAHFIPIRVYNGKEVILGKNIVNYMEFAINIRCKRNLSDLCHSVTRLQLVK